MGLGCNFLIYKDLEAQNSQTVRMTLAEPNISRKVSITYTQVLYITHEHPSRQKQRPQVRETRMCPEVRSCKSAVHDVNARMSIVVRPTVAGATVGAPRYRFDELYADRAYDSDPHRQALREVGTTPLTATCRTKSPRVCERYENKPIFLMSIRRRPVM